jgi:hypothetical protein
MRLHRWRAPVPVSSTSQSVHLTGGPILHLRQLCQHLHLHFHLLSPSFMIIFGCIAIISVGSFLSYFNSFIQFLMEKRPQWAKMGGKLTLSSTATPQNATIFTTLFFFGTFKSIVVLWTTI